MMRHTRETTLGTRSSVPSRTQRSFRVRMAMLFGWLMMVLAAGAGGPRPAMSPTRRSTSIFRSGRSCRTSASTVTAPTPGCARPGCGSIPRRGPSAATKSGGHAIVPGNLDDSELFWRITAEDESRADAPQVAGPIAVARGNQPAQAMDRARRRVEGALVVPAAGRGAVPPDVKNPSWPRNPLDRFVLARLDAEPLTPAPEATKERLIRRLTFDLTGLPPTLAEIDAFLDDPAPDAYERLVDRLLASPRFGERMAVDWLDLARYADTYGYQADVYRAMWPWRDWVIQAFNANLPYDQFITWQLAGDLLPEPTRAQVLATAFNRHHRQTNEGGSIEEEFRVEYVADRTNTFATAFLGLTLECARCHSHKYDPITQKEYYQLFGFFNSIDESGLYSHFTDAVPTPTLLLTSADQDRAIAAIEAKIKIGRGRARPPGRRATAGVRGLAQDAEA